MINNILAPGLVGLWVSTSNRIDTDDDRLPKISGWLCIFQAFLFIFANFVTRNSESRSSFYLSFMTELAYVASISALAIVPSIIIITNLIGFFIWDDFEHLASLMVLNVVTQIGILCQYFFMGYSTLFWQDFLRQKNIREAYRVF
jgi:hypothetical protein